MSYSAKVYNVMIASPSDVSAERGVVREVIHEWNSVNAFTRNTVLMPIGWETHSSPAMGASPQKILNTQILDKCDLLVGVFWTRIGTKTEDYESGTVEEIERHMSSGKPAMLYFSSAPVHPDSVENEQYERLKSFRQSCQSRGLYHAFESLSAFRDNFYRHLQLKVNEDGFFSGSSAPEQEVLASTVPVFDLSKEAKVILKEAAEDPSGVVMFMRYIGGTDLQTNGKTLISGNNRREIALWEDALRQLVDDGLLVERGSKGEYFELTKSGYEAAENIRI
jgi:hypothetical protein